MIAKYCMIALGLLSLSGCYTVNDQRFSAHVRTLVQPGMPMDAAIAALQGNGFSCDAQSPARSTSCSKTRQRLLPSTCIERVNLYGAALHAKVERVEVSKIVCAGL